MQLTTFVVNLDTEKQRWRTSRKHLIEDHGLDPYRWPATTPDQVTLWQPWRSAADNPERRVAINHSYRHLLHHIEHRYFEQGEEGPWLILQDDIHLTEHPARPDHGFIHLYGGYHLQIWRHPRPGVRHPTGRYRLVNPTTSRHVCPQAFLLTYDAIKPLLEHWRYEDRPVCETWTPLLTTDTVTWDPHPTAIEREPHR